MVGVLAFLFILPAVSALQTPTLTFIPDKFSVNASFITVADVGDNVSARVSWVIPGIEHAIGLFPRFGDRYMCYFSNTDQNANCGPGPFTLPGNYTFLIDAVDQAGGTKNLTLSKLVGGIVLSPEIVIRSYGFDVNTDYSGDVEGISYTLYDSSLDVLQSGSLVWEKFTSFKYGESINVTDGIYYLAMQAQGKGAYAGDHGGRLERIQIGFVEPGEGPGVTGYLQVEHVTKDRSYTGEALQPVLAAPGDKVYSGIDGVPLSITNIGVLNLTNLTIQPHEALEDYLGFELSSTGLEPNGTIYYTATVKNIQTALSLDTVAGIYSAGTKVGQVAVKVKAQVLGAIGECPPCPTAGEGQFTLTPASWTGEFVVGQQAKILTITNRAASALTNFTYSATSPLSAILTMDLPSSVPAGGSDVATVYLEPGYSGSYSGTLTISTNTGSQAVFIAANFHRNITSDIEDKKLELEDLRLGMTTAQYNQFSGTLDSIESGLNSALSDMEYGDFGGAQERLTEAGAQLALLSDLVTGGYVPTPGPGPAGAGIDLNMVLVIVVVIAIGVVVYYFLKVRKPGKKEGYEKELEEEF